MLDAYAHDLDLYLASPDRPPCRECSGTGTDIRVSVDIRGGIMKAASDSITLPCWHCGGTGEEPLLDEAADAGEDPRGD